MSSDAQPPEPSAEKTPANKAAGLPNPPPATAQNARAAPPLTPEEQMAAFAEELKEQDWGHQPC